MRKVTHEEAVAQLREFLPFIASQCKSKLEQARIRISPEPAHGNGWTKMQLTHQQQLRQSIIDIPRPDHPFNNTMGRLIWALRFYQRFGHLPTEEGTVL